jgi:sterol desaturase/sphingolipid hydroxylase (fatty acid hydroxylase superfamily)
MISYYFNGIITFSLTGLYTFYKDYYNINKIKNRNHNELFLLYKKILPNVSFNLFISLLPISLYLPQYAINSKLNILSFLPLSIKVILFPFILDCAFYTFHRLLHTKYLYIFHKKHHELIDPVGIGAFYMSSIELYIGNILPVFIPVLLFGSNYYFLHIWTSFTIANAVYISHSNTTNLSNFHDIHHKTFKYNYGLDIFMDKLFNTTKK